MNYWNLLQTKINPPKEIEKQAVKHEDWSKPVIQHIKSNGLIPLGVTTEGNFGAQHKSGKKYLCHHEGWELIPVADDHFEKVEPLLKNMKTQADYDAFNKQKLGSFSEEFTKVAKAFDMSEEEIKLSLEEFNNERPRA